MTAMTKVAFSPLCLKKTADPKAPKLAVVMKRLLLEKSNCLYRSKGSTASVSTPVHRPISTASSLAEYFDGHCFVFVPDIGVVWDWCQFLSLVYVRNLVLVMPCLCLFTFSMLLLMLGNRLLCCIWFSEPQGASVHAPTLWHFLSHMFVYREVDMTHIDW